MKKIAVLGPKGTYSDIAANKYKELINEDIEIDYYPSIIKSINAIDDDTITICPFENVLDGFVTEALDQIIKSNLNIIYQLKLPIDFAFVSNAKSIEDVKHIYVQFKAYGQCLEFITNNNFEIIKTESNIVSLNKLLESDNSYGAIIPIHKAYKNFNLKILNIADSKHNETRFFVVTNKNKEFKINDDFEASLVFDAIEDRPGILYSILSEFNLKNINLKSILSRPDKTIMGKYNFYIEVSGKCNELDNLYELIDKFMKHKDYRIRVLGIYNKIGD